MVSLDGTWDVARVGGFLPPLVGVRKRIEGASGRTLVGPVGVAFDVVGTELRYRAPLTGVVDVLEPAGGGWNGRTLVGGRELGRFRLTAVEDTGLGTIERQLVRHLDETVALEEGVRRMLDAMISAADDADLVHLLADHRAETVEHAERLRERLAAHGARPSAAREAAGALGAFARLPLDLLRGEKTARDARDAYATEHLEIAAYELLERIARRAADEATAEVARRNRADEEAMAQRLAARWDRVVERMLGEAGVSR